MKLARLLPLLLLLLCAAPLSAMAQCPTKNSAPTMPNPAYPPGGNVFGYNGPQWSQFFAAKADANNGILCNPTIIGGVGPGAFTLAPGNTTTQGTENNGTQTMTGGLTLFPQLFIRTKSANYTVNNDNGGISDSGALLIATVNGITFKLPNPSTATKGTTYYFGSDAVHTYVLNTVGGAASFYGCPGGTSTSPSFGIDIAIAATDDGTNYNCRAWGGGTTSFANPTATAGPTANNGSATTAMRSDASPAIQLGSSSQRGILECGSGTTCASGVISVTSSTALPYNVATPTTGGTVNISGSVVIQVLAPSGSLASLTVNFPSSPTDQQIIRISTTQTITSLALTAPGGATVVYTTGTFNPGPVLSFVYDSAATTWYPG